MSKFVYGKRKPSGDAAVWDSFFNGSGMDICTSINLMLLIDFLYRPLFSIGVGSSVASPQIKKLCDLSLVTPEKKDAEEQDLDDEICSSTVSMTEDSSETLALKKETVLPTDDHVREQSRRNMQAKPVQRALISDEDASFLALATVIRSPVKSHSYPVTAFDVQEKRGKNTDSPVKNVPKSLSFSQNAFDFHEDDDVVVIDPLRHQKTQKPSLKLSFNTASAPRVISSDEDTFVNSYMNRMIFKFSFL